LQIKHVSRVGLQNKYDSKVTEIHRQTSRELVRISSTSSAQENWSGGRFGRCVRLFYAARVTERSDTIRPPQERSAVKIKYVGLNLPGYALDMFPGFTSKQLATILSVNQVRRNVATFVKFRGIYQLHVRPFVLRSFES